MKPTSTTTYLTRQQVCSRWGISRSTSYRYEAEGRLPHPRHFGPRAARWVLSELEALEGAHPNAKSTETPGVDGNGAGPTIEADAGTVDARSFPGASLGRNGAPAMEPKVNLGDKVRDPVTGFEGVVTTRCEYLHGVPRVLVEAKVHDGKLNSEWFEESRVTVIA